MSKIKYVGIGLGLGLLTGGSATFCTSAASENTNKQFANSIINNEVTLPSVNTDTIKRQATKIYHRFEDIPEISDNEAILYSKDEYTYIINAEEYQKNGKIKLKRVLTDEITKANLLSLIYRSECATYIPKENEDQMTQYIVDLKIINPTGSYKGPTQMNDVAINSFIKYLAINPTTRQNVLPLLTYKSPTKTDTLQTLEDALSHLEKLCYKDSAQLLPFEQRKNIIANNVYRNIRLNEYAWQKIASPKLKALITKEEAIRKRNNTLRGNALTNTTKNFLCLSELFPDSSQLVKELETYNLTTFPIGRAGIPHQILTTLASSMNLKNNNGELNATRIPLYAIAASISTVNWHGNGLEAIKDAKNLKKIHQQNPNKFSSNLTLIAKKWTAGKSRRYGINELQQMNMITPTVIEQLRAMELPGSEELSQEYLKAIENEEKKIISPQKLDLFAYTLHSNYKR